MILALIFIVLGVFLLLNAFGIIAGNFWGIFWALVFLAIGFKMLAKKGKCPICGWYDMEDKFHDHFHADECCGEECDECDEECGEDCECHEHGAGESKHDEQK